jgi:two-component sensor histidine kinase
MDRDQQLCEGQIKVLTMIARDAPSNDILSAVVAFAEAITPAAIAGITIGDCVGQTIERAVFPSLDRAFADALAGVSLRPPHVGACAQAIYWGEAVTSDDLSHDPRFAKEWLQLCAEHGIRSCHSQPVRNAEGVSLGTFTLCFREPRTVDCFDKRLIDICAELAELILAGRRLQERHELIVGELEHRIKNVLAMVGALAHVSFIDGATISASRAAFDGRLAALANAQSMMLAVDGMDLERLLNRMLKPYPVERIDIAGPLIRLTPEATAGLGMAIHELATNAVKYGALSTHNGHVKVNWDVAHNHLRQAELSLRWVESDGPEVKTPHNRGFGMRAVERLLANEVEGEVQFDFAADGLRCTITAPLGNKLGYSVPEKIQLQA